MVLISALSIGVAFVSGLVARVLTALIGLITNISFYGKIDLSFASPAGNRLGAFVVLVPVAGGLVVGIMARFGSKAIRGHGIPEAMEQVLFNQSRIPARITFLKPLSAAIAIGTGGPFGAEGPIIATGGALGSLVGQFVKTTADERKTLLAAGAAAGMAATFGSPVSAVLLAIELLLFEYRARSMIPVAFATVVAAGVRVAFVGAGPVFVMHDVIAPSGEGLVGYAVVGAVSGAASVYVTRLVYWIEDLFDRLPIHWMWWPAMGAVVVGVVGTFAPRTMGVGYDNIDRILEGDLVGGAMLWLCGWKLVSWSIALGSGTSGGTLAPLFTIGGGLGAAVAAVIQQLAPNAHIDPRVGALVGMAAVFAGASRALLTSVVFAFETTRQPLGLLPLLAGCTTGHLISSLLMKNTIMTEKLARRGARIPSDYAADFLASVPVTDVMTAEVITLRASDRVDRVRAWLASKDAAAQHQGYPVMDGERLIGVLTRRDLFGDSVSLMAEMRALIKRAPVVVGDEASLRDAADQMARAEVGRVPVVREADRNHLVGIATRSDLLGAHKRRLDAGVRQSSPSPFGRFTQTRVR